MTDRRIIDLPKEIFKLPALERLLAQFTQGKSPSNLIARFPPLYRSYPKNSIRRVYREGIRYELDISDYMEWLIYWGIRAEKRDQLYKVVQRGWQVADVGANVGEVALNLAKRVGPEGSVYAFEPDSIAFSKLFLNHSLNNFDNVTLINVGLGAKPEKRVLMAEVDYNRGGSRIQSNLCEGQTVNLTSMDLFMEENQVDKLDLIKIDVEGYEHYVLEGAIEVIRKSKPILFVEVNDTNLRAQGTTARDLVRFLELNEYKHVLHADSGKSIDSSQSFAGCHIDIIAS